MPMHLKQCTVNDYSLFYQENGRGAPLVFVHGSLGDYRSWDAQVRFFSRTFRTICLSLRHSYPERWDGRGGGFSIRQHADDLAAFIHALNCGPVHLVGHSRGGAVALKALADHPGLCRTAVLADPAPFKTMLSDLPAALGELARRNATVSRAVEQMGRGDLDGGLATFFDAVTAPGAWRKLPEATRQMRRDNAWSLKSLIADAGEPFGRGDAEKIGIPVLLTTGADSPAIYGMMHHRLGQCLQKSARAVIPESSHGMHWDNPDAFNTVVHDFLGG